MIKCIIFDFDDTLEEFRTTRDKAQLEVGEYIKKKYRIPKRRFSREFYGIDHHYTRIGPGKSPNLYDRHLWFSDFFRKHKIKASRNEIKKLSGLYWEKVMKHVKLFPSTKSVLKKLKQKKAIISDSDGSKKRKVKRIKKLGIYNLIDLIITSDDTGINKPNRKFYDIIFRKFKIRPEECIMVGDKPEVDLKLAKRLGMKTVWIVKGHWALMMKNRNFNYVDFKINNIKQLPKCVNSLIKQK